MPIYEYYTIYFYYSIQHKDENFKKRYTKKTKLLSIVNPLIKDLSKNSNFVNLYIILIQYFIVIHPMCHAIGTFHQELLLPL